LTDVRTSCGAVCILAALVAMIGPASADTSPIKLSFGETMRRALARNPDALIAIEEIARAKAIVEEVRAASLPTLISAAAFLQLDHARISEVNPSVIIDPATQFNASGTADLLLRPQGWVQWAQARENVVVARLSAANVRRLLATAVGQTYLSVLAQHQVIDADALGVQNAAAHVDYTHQRLVAGNGTQLDYQRAAALYNSERTLQENARFLLVRLQEQLGILIAESGPVDVVEDVRFGSLPADPTSALDDAQRLRSDLRLSRESLVAATRVRRDSWADYVPWIDANYRFFYQTPPTQTLPTTGWQLTLTLGFTIYDGGLRYGLLKERRALEHEARIRVDNELRLVSADVRTAESELAHARVALATAREAARLSADTLRLTIVAYHAGLSTNIEVIDAQTAALNADVSAALADNNERQAELDLLLASGRFP
jgi:outer membrane protein TolC